MKCTEFLDAYSDWEDGGLSQEARLAFDAHLAVCAACRRYADVLRKGRELLAALPPVEVGADFAPRLKHRIYHLADDSPLFRDRGNSGTTAVTLLALAVLMAVAAWSPSFRRPVVVELPAIVVNQPPQRPVQLRYRTAPLDAGFHDRYRQRSLWSGADHFLFETSPLRERYRQGAVSGVGLD